MSFWIFSSATASSAGASIGTSTGVSAGLGATHGDITVATTGASTTVSERVYSRRDGDASPGDLFSEATTCARTALHAAAAGVVLLVAGGRVASGVRVFFDRLALDLVAAGTGVW